MTHEHEPHTKHLHPFLAKIRRYFLTGVLVATPITLTIILLTWLIKHADRLMSSIIPKTYNPETYLPYDIPGLGLLFAFIFLTLFGAIATGLFGRFLIRTSESIVDRMPVVRGIYGAIKQIIETIFDHSQRAFRQVVLVEFPYPGRYVIGFVTSDSPKSFSEMVHEDLVNVFVPTTPNPTSGYLMLVPRKELKILNISPEDGIKMIVSGGLVKPETIKRFNQKKSS